MNVVDSSAWITFFTGARHCKTFAGPISEFGELLVPSITLHEVYRYLQRHLDHAAALNATANMQRGRVVALDGQLAIEAALVAEEHRLPLADSIIYATARRYDAVVWTQDGDFKGLDKVQYFAP